MNLSFSEKEIKDIVYSTLAIGFIFAYGSEFSISLFLIMSLIVALSFIPHELAHKFVAVKYGCFAQYQMWKSGLILALFMTVFLGIVFIAPGAVVIYPVVHSGAGIRRISLTARQNALISAAGPAMNILIAFLFLPLAGQNEFFSMIVWINGFLALFNLLPFPPLDGSKIIWYNFLMWGAMIGVSGYLCFFLI